MKKILRFLTGSGNYNPGEIAGFDEKKAEGYIAAGIAEEVTVDDEGVVTPAGGTEAEGKDAAEVADPNAETKLEDLTKAELIALAEERKVEVTRADGGDGDPLVEDYIRALSAAE